MTHLEARIEQVGPTTSKAAVRSHTLFVDRPAAKGGADRGPMGGEYLLVALAGCFTSHLLAAIRAREAAISDVRVSVRGTMDGMPERFTAVTLTVDAVHRDAELLRSVVAQAERACQVSNTLREIVQLSVVIHAPAGQPS